MYVVQTGTLSQTAPGKKGLTGTLLTSFIAKVLQEVNGVPVAANMASGWNPVPEGSR